MSGIHLSILDATAEGILACNSDQSVFLVGQGRVLKEKRLAGLRGAGY